MENFDFIIEAKNIVKDFPESDGGLRQIGRAHV